MNCCEKNKNDSDNNYNKRQSGPLKTIYWVIPITLGLYYLWGWHRQHVLELWPIILIFACPLMHFFGHRNHNTSKKENKDPSKGEMEGRVQ